MWRKFFLVCGIIASLLYVGMNIFIPMQDPNYNSFSQTVSELSAIDSQTRPIWLPLGYFYSLLMVLFGLGVYVSAQTNRPVHIIAVLLIVYGIVGLFWPPMHLRPVLAAGGKTLTDTLHIVFTSVSVLLMILGMGFGAAAFGKNFRIYSIATIVTLLFFGILTSISAPNVQANLPTPWIGVWERINIGVFLLWVIILAIKLLRNHQPGASKVTTMA